MDNDQSASISSDFVSSESYNQSPADQQQPGFLSRVAGGAYNTTATIVGGVAGGTSKIVGGVAGGAYNTTATIVGGAVGGAKYVASPVVGGATWITGTALSTSFGFAKSIGGYVLPTRFRPAIEKDKSE